jgi:hypothetical protein
MRRQGVVVPALQHHALVVTVHRSMHTMGSTCAAFVRNVALSPHTHARARAAMPVRRCASPSMCSCSMHAVASHAKRCSCCTRTHIRAHRTPRETHKADARTPDDAMLPHSLTLEHPPPRPRQRSRWQWRQRPAQTTPTWHCEHFRLHPRSQTRQTCLFGLPQHMHMHITPAHDTTWSTRPTHTHMRLLANDTARACALLHIKKSPPR